MKYIGKLKIVEYGNEDETASLRQVRDFAHGAWFCANPDIFMVLMVQVGYQRKNS